MKNLRISISVFLIILIITTPVMADIDSMLDNVISGVYTQDPGMYRSPSTTTLSGGSFSFRLKNDVLGRPIINFRSSQASISCSGMDFDAGMMSVLNLDLFEQMLSQGGVSLAWGVMIGLVYSLPGVGESFQKLNEWARDIQKLMQSPCQVGKALGKKIGNEIIEGEGTSKAEEKARKTGRDFSQTMKEILEELTVADFYKTYPYAALKNMNLDSDVLKLIAGFFGVLDIFLVDSNGKKINPDSPGVKLSEACGGPCGAKNIKMKVLKQPSAELFKALLYGSTEKTMGMVCDPSVIDDSCLGVTEVEIYTAGLVNKISATLTEAINSYSVGDGLLGQIQQIKTYNTMLPQLQGMLKYAANYRRYKVDENKHLKISKVMAEYLSVLILHQIFDSIYSYVYSAVGSNSSNGTNTELQTYLKQLDAGMEKFRIYAKQISENYGYLAQSHEQYKAIYEQTLSQVGKKLGQGAFLQLHTYR